MDWFHLYGSLAAARLEMVAINRTMSFMLSAEDVGSQFETAVLRRRPTVRGKPKENRRESRALILAHGQTFDHGTFLGVVQIDYNQTLVPPFHPPYHPTL